MENNCLGDLFHIMILNHSKLTDRLSGALHIVVLLDSVHDPLVGGVGGDEGDVVVVLLVLIQPEVVVHHVAGYKRLLTSLQFFQCS